MQENHKPTVEDIIEKGIEEEKNVGEILQDVKEETEKKTPGEQLQEFLDDKENIKTLTVIAEAMQKKFNGNWFDFQQVLKKTPYKDSEGALNMLNLLRFAGLLQPAMRNKREMYKITLNSQAKVTLLEDRLQELNKEKETIEAELLKLKETTT